MEEISSKHRRPNFSSDEMDALTDAVSIRKALLFGKFSGVVSLVAKEKAWEEIAKEISAISGIKRSTIETKKKWSYLKSDAKKRGAVVRSSIVKTGGGPPISTKLSAIDDKILSIVGKESVEGIVGGVDTSATLLMKYTIGSCSDIDGFDTVDDNQRVPFNADSFADGIENIDDQTIIENETVVISDIPKLATKSDHFPSVKKISKKRMQHQSNYSAMTSNQLEMINIMKDLVSVEKERLQVEKERLQLETLKFNAQFVVEIPVDEMNSF